MRSDITGIAYLDAAVKVIPVSEGANGPFIAPTYENVALATYPLSRLVFFNVNKAPGKPLPPVLDEFLRFILSREGQQAVLDQCELHPVARPPRCNPHAPCC
jgi:phosphate transport system substrate-binding protein